MTPRLSRTQRQALLAAHLGTSVAWLGAVLSALLLATLAQRVADPATRRAAYVALDLLDTTVLFPLAIGALGTGVLLSVFTKWGLVRFRWVLVKLVATGVLVGGGTVALHERVEEAIRATAGAGAAAPAAAPWLVAAGAVKAILLAALILISVMKPWGMTRWGRRAAAEAGR